MVKTPYFPKPRPTYGLKPLSKLSEPLISRSVRDRGALLNQILILWPEIAGEAAMWSRPISVSVHKKDKSDTALKLEIESGRGPTASMLIPKLIAKINAACGFNAIRRISLQQTGYSGKYAPRPQQRTDQRTIAPDRLNEITEHITSPELRSSLQRLGEALRKR